MIIDLNPIQFPTPDKYIYTVYKYEGKGDVYECSNFRGISSLSVVGKVYGRILIKRIRDKTENVIVEVQSGFRRGRGCTDPIFIVRRYARSI